MSEHTFDAHGSTPGTAAATDETDETDATGAASTLTKPRAHLVHDGEEHEVMALEAKMAELAGALNMIHGELVELIATALERGFWHQSGIHSPQHWLAWQLGLSTSRARQLLAVATRAHAMPDTLTALRDGDISLEQAGVVTRYVPTTHQQAATRLARNATVHQLTRALAKYPYGPPEPHPDPDPQPAKPRPHRRGVRFHTDEHGNWHLRVVLPGDEGHTAHHALAAARDELFHQATPAEPDQPNTVSWADAFVHALDTMLDDRRARHPRAPRYKIYAHLEARPGAAATDPWDLSHHLHSPLPAALRRLITCDADITPVHHRDGIPIGIGEPHRIVSDRLRHLVEHRDGGCAVPGCTRRHHLQIHHILHWEDGGLTVTWNLLTLCPRHHRSHHRGQLHIRGNADRPHTLTFTDEHGRVLATAGTPAPPVTAPHAARPYRHPSGERWSPRWLELTPDPPDPPGRN